MAKIADLTVDVKAKMNVERDTAELCLKLIEIYCNANNIDIIGEKEPYQIGSDVHFHFERRKDG